MGMQFVITLTGTIESEVQAEDLGIDLDDLNGLLDISSSVQFDGNAIYGEVTINADARVEGVEVSAADLADYDAETALNEHVNPYGYGSVQVESADFDIVDEPTGFDVVTEALGHDRDEAIKVYAALDSAGLSVN